MFGMWEAILAQIQSTIGNKTDVPNVQGSLHSRVQAILMQNMQNGLLSIPQSAVDTIISSNTSFEGYNFFKKLTINAGVTYSTLGSSGVIIADEIIVNGLISASGKGAAGASAVTASSSNGTYGTAGSSVSNALGGAGGGGGGGGDNAGSSGTAEHSGGAGGSASGSAGSAGTSGSSSTVNGSTGGKAIYKGKPDNLALFIGAGGGSGGAAGDDTGSPYPTSGAGGAGGGAMMIVANKITVNTGGAIRADGLNGGNPSGTKGSAGGGGGGGGGSLFVFCGQLTNNGAITANGGTGGMGQNWTDELEYIGNGGNGGDGILFIVEV